MKTSSKREQHRIRQQQQSRRNYLIGGAVAILVLGILGFVLWQAVKPAAGQAVTIPAGYQTHVDIGTPLTYPSNPPAGGLHYAEEFEAGFYDEETIPNRPGAPEGYLVHNLEHGYVIFWYNCSNLDANACSDLKANIKSVMDARNNFKLIAFPWKSIDGPLAMTSWGRIQNFDQFDAGQVKAFIDNNLNRSPEPDAP